MAAKKLGAILLVILGLFVQAAFAQKTPMLGTNITVSQSGGGMFTTIQAAVNAAKPGQIIEILDTVVYKEQVTIDGREESPWRSRGVTGGKNGITIRYVPAPGVVGRPVIMYQDTTNRIPVRASEVLVPGDLPGQRDNFETCAALRILHASGVTIEGVVIDGGGAAPFGANVYSGGWPLFHGNAAVAVVISSNVSIRDCELKNAYFGMYVKDRNDAGVFGDPDPDFGSAHLSGFGKTGNHLIEYNRICDNSVGLFFEFLYDFGSTVRYNLIYNNYHRISLVNVPGGLNDKISGAIMFKDSYLTPIAIYNNTFFGNSADLVGGWRAGYPHLIFNNIFSAMRGGLDRTYDLTANFPNRMNHNVFSATEIVRESRHVDQCQSIPLGILGQSIPGIVRVRVLNNDMLGSSAVVNCLPPIGDMTVTTSQFVNPGTVIHNSEFTASGNNRWLEMAGYTTTNLTLPNLFKSTDNPKSPDFLVPDWDAKEVQDFIRNRGWPQSGIINEDGSAADLGAIPFSGRRPCDDIAQTSRARIKPIDIVKVNGTSATVSFYVTQEIGSLDNLGIKFLRWIVPVPDNDFGRVEFFGSNGIVVPDTSIHVITSTFGMPLIKAGANTVTFTIPASIGNNARRYGFFEMVLEGTDGIGRRVTTDVGFLPYRRVDYEPFVIQVIGENGAPVNDPVVTAGDPVTIRVTAQATIPVGGVALDVGYKLASDPAARMLLYETDAALENERWAAGATVGTHTVYFTKAGDEVISAVGTGGVHPDSRAFLGSLPIKVLPVPVVIDEPDKPETPPPSIVFLSPVSKSSLDGAQPPVINGYYYVEVQLRDSFGNAVNRPINVTLTSGNSALAIIPFGVVATDSATGTARFLVYALLNAPEDVTFDLTASITHNGVLISDVASLRTREKKPDEPDIVPPPRIVGGEYKIGAGSIYAAELQFNEDVGEDWFSSMEFAFSSRTRGTMTNRGCIHPVVGSPRSVMVVLGCGFPGTNFTENMGDGSRITVNYSALKGWAPQTVDVSGLNIVKVLETDRVIPKPDVNDPAIDPPPVVSASKFTAGPNPVGKQSGAINFFWQGKRIQSASLRIFDASGNVVNRKIPISDRRGVALANASINTVDKLRQRDSQSVAEPVEATSRRQVGSWNLTDGKGRPVSEGTYLVRGVIITSDGKKEHISLMIGVR